MYWCNLRVAWSQGLQFYQTRSNAIILYETLPAYCISKVVVMKSEEIIYQKVHVSPRFPPKISFKDNWMKDLDSEVAGDSGKDSQRVQPKSKTQLSSTVRLVSEQPPGLLTKEIGKDVLFGCESTNSRTVRPVKSCVPVSVERVHKDKDADENVDADQTRTGRITCDVYRKGGGHEVRRSIVQQNVSISYFAAKNCTSNRTCTMNIRTLQGLTRERPSTIPASTEKSVAVERTRKLVAAKLT